MRSLRSFSFANFAIASGGCAHGAELLEKFPFLFFFFVTFTSNEQTLRGSLFMHRIRALTRANRTPIAVSMNFVAYRRRYPRILCSVNRKFLISDL